MAVRPMAILALRIVLGVEGRQEQRGGGDSNVIGSWPEWCGSM